MARAPKPPRWYFSLRSPYSYFAYRDLVDRYPDVADALEWIPFWEPDPLTLRMLDEADVRLAGVPMSRAKHFYILQDTRRLARARGLALTWPVDRAPVWEVSHLGYLVADDAGLGRGYVDRVYRARWVDGRDISDRQVIAGIAADLGLPADRVAGAADDADLRRRGVECLARSAADGLFGVPFFALGHERFFGVDRLRLVVAAARGEAPPGGPDQGWLDDLPGPDPGTEPPELVTPGGDAGHAGGCG
jgi:2-hydroxychromene-2-carboxylate isomerase